MMKNPVDFVHLINEIPLGILILDTDRRVILLNRAFEILSGFSHSTAYGVQCHNILRSAACISNCPVLSIQDDNRPVSCKTDMINLDRQRLPIRMTTAALIDNNNQITGFIETVEDIRLSQHIEKIKSSAYSFANIVGRSPQMEKIFQTLPVLSQSDASILITGETGTGKDLVAEAIHQTSGREAGPFIKINCGALPETLLESEIFGHQKGAFTGAIENKPGRFKLAHNGTIFLTEIGDLPLSLQVKLLTFLDDKIIYPLGSTAGFRANVRIIAATHRNLEQMVERGLFRKDLLFRLNVARIHLPPLREREGDIRLLIDHFFNSYTQQLDKKINGFSKDSLMILLNYRYDGNIRELKNIIEYAVNISNNSTIEINHLPAYLLEAPLSHSTGPDLIYTSTGTQNSHLNQENFLHNTKKSSGEPETWSLVQRQIIMDALKKTNGKKNEAAKILGWGRSTLWRKIKQFKIDS
ncbi:MAG: sigma 54-interacting transcriptional regulator [Proteobacteria bacterium]|nr:sigma 54-interacting transcriptional regulator [Pseudomonadota bacterium]MBU1386727.1 sigma 54-interacting transcriptional regulator [Pseudomonadota bacterium]MBU1544375.1 sigma 54-interacting transcriptional regulator [Pseudomonadota bacterium]MBU2481753.1 sigma 54-interacting transcriptional regulator [Pseudomonadota bacterium]